MPKTRGVGLHLARPVAAKRYDQLHALFLRVVKHLPRHLVLRLGRDRLHVAHEDEQVVLLPAHQANLVLYHAHYAVLLHEHLVGEMRRVNLSHLLALQLGNQVVGRNLAHKAYAGQPLYQDGLAQLQLLLFQYRSLNHENHCFLCSAALRYGAYLSSTENFGGCGLDVCLPQCTASKRVGAARGAFAHPLHRSPRLLFLRESLI